MSSAVIVVAEMIATANTPTAPMWAASIRSSWQKSIDGILETGRLLAEAKSALPHGAFEAMVRSDLPFAVRTARQLMQIHANPALSNRQHAAVLPASWSTLAELSRLAPDEIDVAVKKGLIRPELERKRVPALANAVRRAMGRRTRAIRTTPAAPRHFLVRLRRHLGRGVAARVDRLGQVEADQLLDDVGEFIERTLNGTHGELVVRLWRIDAALSRTSARPDDDGAIDAFARELFGLTPIDASAAEAHA